MQLTRDLLTRRLFMQAFSAGAVSLALPAASGSKPLRGIFPIAQSPFTAADKLDLLLQAREYERGGARGLNEFWQSAETEFSRLGVAELIADLVESLKKERG